LQEQDAKKQVNTEEAVGDTGRVFSFFFPRLTWTGQRMLRWTEASVWWSNSSVVVTYENTSFASVSTHLELMGRDIGLEEPGRYGPGMLAPPRAVLPGMLAPDISVPMMPKEHRLRLVPL
jgi:hypothetical protein